MNEKAKAWIKASRLRTLPLALSCIGMGSFLAAFYGAFSLPVLVLSLLTTVFLQVLSNLANDYGDTVSGVDSQEREGPGRTVQAGLISLSEMKYGIILMSALSLICGVSLIIIAFQDNWVLVLIFLILGLLAIYAAITYTAGKSPYGYAGFGDISVFIFFGLLGVMGSFYLHTGFLTIDIALPAASCGLLATGVLNVNNIRDIVSDSKAGKRSIPVRLGRKYAVYYHWTLLIVAVILASLFVIMNYIHPAQMSFLIVVPLLLKNALAVYKKEKAMELDPYLKQMALSTMVFVLVFGISHLLVK